jgi:putative flippase GtrA
MADGARFAAAMTAVTRKLPFGLARVVAPSVVGYLLINLCTFFIDLSLLAIFHGTLRWPVPVAVTLSYGTAGMISYIANRTLNFRSHGSLGRQLPVYVLIMVSNYLIFVLGVTTGLTAAGLYYELSRVTAATFEGVYLYCCMRWIVFREMGRPDHSADRGPAAAPGGATRTRAVTVAAPRQASGEPEPE